MEGSLPEGEETLKNLRSNLEQLQPAMLITQAYDGVNKEMNKAEEDFALLSAKTAEIKYEINSKRAF